MYQHGQPVDTHQLCLRTLQVAQSIPSTVHELGKWPAAPVVVEFCTRDPYSVTRGVVTAVGFVDDSVLLTVEPVA